jgi:hypothetical protein
LTPPIGGAYSIPVMAPCTATTRIRIRTGRMMPAGGGCDLA